MIIPEKVQFLSYRVLELIAQNIKYHILGESHILPMSKKFVKIFKDEAAK